METVIRRVPLSCNSHNHRCRQKPSTTTITKFIPKTIPYPCIVTKTVRRHHKRDLEPNNEICTETQTLLQTRQGAELCRKPPCGRKIFIETVTDTVVRPCVKTKHVPVPTTVRKPYPVKCTATEVETITEIVPCKVKPCSPKTKTKCVTTTRVKPCIQKETDVVTKTVTVGIPKPFPIPVRCTVTEVETVLETVTCSPKHCKQKIKTNFITTTKVHPCVVKETETATKTVAFGIPKPYPVRCTYTTTETEIIKYPATCLKHPCPKTKTVTKHHTKTFVKPCIVKETETTTKSRYVPVPVIEEKYVTNPAGVPVTKKVPVICTVIETLTEYRTVPKHCDKHPCGVKTVTDYVPITKIKHCVQTETDVVTKTKHHHHVHKETETDIVTEIRHHHHLHPVTETDFVTERKHLHHVHKEIDTAFVTRTKHHHHLHEVTETALSTKTMHHLHLTTKTKLCKVTETETLTSTKKKWCVKTCDPVTSTTVVTHTKTKPCVVTETLPVPFALPIPLPFTKTIPVPFPVPVPVDHTVPVPCTEASCPAPSQGPGYEPPDYVPQPPKLFRRHDDDQSPTTPVLAIRQCDEHGVILHFDADGLLRDQLNRIGYIADNYQFQFDLPVQSGGYGEHDFGEYTDSGTGDVYLTWRDSDIFYRCRSGNFYNLYSQAIAAHCEPAKIRIHHCVVRSR